MILTLMLFIGSVFANDSMYWIKVDAQDKFQRSTVANTGAVIEVINDDYVVALGNKDELKALEKTGMVLQSFPIDLRTFDFPERDRNFHNYNEVIEFMTDLQTRFPSLVKIEDIGASIEGRKIYNIRI
ncbi:MAG: hypothetical protein KDD37_10475, partial [Bdellovibrionales bacterium]|nr:hypothetical protein [Bdellovibrionales bacterium]